MQFSVKKKLLRIRGLFEAVFATNHTSLYFGSKPGDVAVRWALFPVLFVQMKIKIEASKFQQAFSKDLLSQTKLDTVEVV